MLNNTLNYMKPNFKYFDYTLNRVEVITDTQKVVTWTASKHVGKSNKCGSIFDEKHFLNADNFETFLVDVLYDVLKYGDLKIDGLTIRHHVSVHGEYWTILNKFNKVIAKMTPQRLVATVVVNLINFGFSYQTSVDMACEVE